MDFLAKILGCKIAGYVIEKEKAKKIEGVKHKKKRVLFDLIKNHEDFILTAFIENDEIKINIRRKDINNDTNR